MRINNILTAIALGGMAATGGVAHATPITVTSTYTALVSNATGNAPTISDQLANPFSVNLNLNTTTKATDFIAITPAACFGAAYGNGSCKTTGTATATITATFSFTKPSGITGTATDTGTYTANYYNNSYYDTDSIDWSSSHDPILVTFTDGATMSITLGDTSDWTLDPTITFDLTKDPTAAPEPATLTLLGAGLFGLGIIRRRSSPTA